MKLSILIPHKTGIEQRDRIWLKVLQRYQRIYPDLELCVGEDYSEPFCKARAVNQAVRKATGEFYLIADSDVIFPADLVPRLMEKFNEYPWIIPFQRGLRLNREASDRLLEQNLPEQIVVEDRDVEEEITHPGALMCAVKRSAFEAVSGFDERFKGWGFEDSTFALTLNTICGPYIRMEGDIYHLWHPKAETQGYNNLLLWARYVKTGNDVAAMQEIIKERFQS